MINLYDKLRSDLREQLQFNLTSYPITGEDLVEKLKREDNFLRLSLVDFFNLVHLTESQVEFRQVLVELQDMFTTLTASISEDSSGV